MKYKVYVETEKIEKIDEYDFEDMIFCLDYAIRVLHWNRKILVIEHNTELNMDKVYYIYNGNIQDYIDWREQEKKKMKKNVKKL